MQSPNWIESTPSIVSLAPVGGLKSSGVFMLPGGGPKSGGLFPGRMDSLFPLEPGPKGNEPGPKLFGPPPAYPGGGEKPIGEGRWFERLFCSGSTFTEVSLRVLGGLDARLFDGAVLADEALFASDCLGELLAELFSVLFD